MRRGMLRSEIQGEVAQLGFSRGCDRCIGQRQSLFASGYSLFIGFAVACLLVARQRVGWTFPRRQEMIDNVEAALAAWPVDRGDVDEAPELAALVVAQKPDDLHDVMTDRADRQLAVCNEMARERICKRAGDGLAEFVEPIIHCV